MHPIIWHNNPNAQTHSKRFGKAGKQAAKMPPVQVIKAKTAVEIQRQNRFFIFYIHVNLSQFLRFCVTINICLTT